MWRSFGGRGEILIFIKHVAWGVGRELVKRLVSIRDAKPVHAIRHTQYPLSMPMLITAFVLTFGYSAWDADVALAHGGGTPQLVDAKAGPYHIFMWTQPEPLHAGDVHVTIAVILPNAKGQNQNDSTLNQNDLAVTDASVQVSFALPQRAQEIVVQTDLGEWTGVPYYEADVTLPAAGNWQASIAVDGPLGTGDVAFDLPVLPPREINWPLVAGGSVIVILLLGLAIGWSRVQSGRAESAAVGV